MDAADANELLCRRRRGCRVGACIGTVVMTTSTLSAAPVATAAEAAVFSAAQTAHLIELSFLVRREQRHHFGVSGFVVLFHLLAKSGEFRLGLIVHIAAGLHLRAKRLHLLEERFAFGPAGLHDRFELFLLIGSHNLLQFAVATAASASFSSATEALLLAVICVELRCLRVGALSENWRGNYESRERCDSNRIFH